DLLSARDRNDPSVQFARPRFWYRRRAFDADRLLSSGIFWRTARTNREDRNPCRQHSAAWFERAYIASFQLRLAFITSGLFDRAAQKYCLAHRKAADKFGSAA